MRLIWFVMAMVSVPAAAAEQARFDLVCKSKKETIHYRIDLAAGEYCSGECKHVQKIAAITTGTITLQDDKPQFRDDDRILNSINRITGEWFYSTALPKIGFFDQKKGVCERAEFSGIASTSPKF